MVKGVRVDSGERVTRRKNWGKKGQRKKLQVKGEEAE